MLRNSGGYLLPSSRSPQPMKFQTSSVSTRLAKAKSAKARSRDTVTVPAVVGSSCSRRHTAGASRGTVSAE